MIRKAECQGTCGRHLRTSDMIKIKNPSKGWHYMCPTCYERQESYSTDNNTFKGDGLKGRKNSISLEFEVSSRNRKPHQFLAQYGWLNTSDGTVVAKKVYREEKSGKLITER